MCDRSGVAGLLLSTIDDAIETKCLLNWFAWSREAFKSFGIDFTLPLGRFQRFFNAFHNKRELCFFSSSSFSVATDLTLFPTCATFVLALLKVALGIFPWSSSFFEVTTMFDRFLPVSFISQEGLSGDLTPFFFIGACVSTTSSTSLIQVSRISSGSLLQVSSMLQGILFKSAIRALVSTFFKEWKEIQTCLPRFLHVT